MLSTRPDPMASDPSHHAAVESDEHPPRSAACAHGDPTVGVMLHRLATRGNSSFAADHEVEAIQSVYRYVRRGRSAAVPSATAVATVLDVAAGTIVATTWQNTLVAIVRIPEVAADQPVPAVTDGAATLPPVEVLPDGVEADALNREPYLAYKPAAEGRTLGFRPDPAVEWWSQDRVVSHLRGALPELIAADRLFGRDQWAAFEADTPADVREELQTTTPDDSVSKNGNIPTARDVPKRSLLPTGYSEDTSNADSKIRSAQELRREFSEVEETDSSDEIAHIGDDAGGGEW